MGLVNDDIKLEVLKGLQTMGTQLVNCIHGDLKESEINYMSTLSSLVIL